MSICAKAPRTRRPSRRAQCTSLTMAIKAGSPAIDVAQNCSEFDQRGMKRVGLCDAGAFEFQP